MHIIFKRDSAKISLENISSITRVLDRLYGYLYLQNIVHYLSCVPSDDKYDMEGDQSIDDDERVLFKSFLDKCMVKN